MKIKILRLFFILSFIYSSASELLIEKQPTDPFDIFIFDMFQKQQNKTMCSAPNDSIKTIRTNLISYIQFNGYSNSLTPQVIATALWTLYPCPFSPFRSEIRSATKEDIVGGWVFPEESQKIRFGSYLAQKSPLGPLPIKCDAIGYYPNGEFRQIIVSGQPECPFKKAADLDIARKNPRVSNWSLLNDGRISITRTDVANHIEEWDTFVVVTPFAFNDIQFKAGDIIAYLRRENGNEVGASTQFRHLQRLQ
ncbi:MAG TPA: hypothetical protein VJA83_05830 [Sulfuricurvum sp.]|nr:hypothetical protein [Sulfuricurvum sp.]